MISQKHEPEIEGLLNMCSKGTVAGILVLCDILKPVIEFSDYLPGGNANFSEVKKKLTDLVDELHLLIDRFRGSLRKPDVDLYFSRLLTLFDEIDDRTNLQRRLRDKGVYDALRTVEEVAVPITHGLIHELEDAFYLPPVLAAFDAFSLEFVPNIDDLEDYMKNKVGIFLHNYSATPVSAGGIMQRDPLPDLYTEMTSDPAFRNSCPVMFFLVGLSRIIPSSTASVERVFSLMNSLCTSWRSSVGQATLDVLMRICVHNQQHTSLSDRQISGIIDLFKNMKTRELYL